MPVLSYDRAIAEGLTSKSIMRCALWNVERANRPAQTDTEEDVSRFVRQAKALHRVALALEKNEMFSRPALTV